MKKILLFTGALLSLGALSACGQKQAKNIDLSLKEFDEKFKLPNGLLDANQEFADFAFKCVMANLSSGKENTVPYQTTYEQVSNINAAINAGKGQDDSGFKKRSIYGASVSKGTTDGPVSQIPIDSTALYRNSRTETMFLYDNFLSEYKLSASRRYINENGGELKYKTNESLYNFWPEKISDGKYYIKQYTKENKNDGSKSFDYTNPLPSEGQEMSIEDANEAVRTGVGTTVAQMYNAVIYGNTGKTDVSERLPKVNKQLSDYIETLPYVPAYDTQFKYYRTADYNTIYIFESKINNISCVTSTLSKQTDIADYSKLIPIYSVTTKVAKISRFDADIRDWRVDYAGALGKTFAVKDNNLVVFDKPRCVSSEYYFVSSSYDKIGEKANPDTTGVNEYDSKQIRAAFNGFAIQEYDQVVKAHVKLSNDEEETIEYEDLSNPNNIILDSKSTIYGDTGKKKDKLSDFAEGELEIEEAINLGTGLDLSDATVAHRTSETDKKFYFEGTYDPTTRRNYGIVLGVLDYDKVELDNITENSDKLMSSDKIHADTFSTDELHWGGYDASNKTSNYVVSGMILANKYDVVICVEVNSKNKVVLNSVNFMRTSGGFDFDVEDVIV